MHAHMLRKYTCFIFIKNHFIVIFISKGFSFIMHFKVNRGPFIYHLIYEKVSFVTYLHITNFKQNQSNAF